MIHKNHHHQQQQQSVFSSMIYGVNTWDTVHHHQGSVGDPEGGGDLGGEVHMTRRIDQVDEEAVSIFTLLYERQVILSQLVEQRDGPESHREESGLFLKQTEENKTRFSLKVEKQIRQRFSLRADDEVRRW